MKEQINSILNAIPNRENIRIVAIVGSGASVASGLKTFRGKDGHFEGKRAEDLASRSGFQEDPELVWNWYKGRISNSLNASPNPIHHTIVKLEKHGLLSVLITQNVDGLHRRAGQTKMIEIHGNILKTHCFDNCGQTGILDIVPETVPIPCECGSLQRPSVVWFGEALNYDDLLKIEKFLIEASIVLIIGTSGYVYPVAQFPVFAKYQGNAKLIEFNTEVSAFDDINDLFIKGPAEETLPEFVKILLESIS